MDSALGVSEFEVRAADGRRLSVRAAGPEDGPVVICHAGTPGSHHMFVEYLEEGAKRGLRHVCYMRPGYHGSDRLPGRTIADTAADTAAVANAVGAERFYLVGHSGGGSPALGEAAQLPDRVRAVAVLATFAPPDAEGLDWRAGLDAANGEELAAFEAGDVALQALLERFAVEFRAIKHGSQVRDAFRGSCCQADLDTLEGRFLDYQLESFPRAVEGGIWGWLDDDKAVWSDWGFDLTQIAVPISIWQGGEDGIVPTAHGEWLADRVPGARLHLLPEDGHLSIMRCHYGAILDELIALG
jgi:pimeloyl-ACP methyl ester carboxylesterase